MDFPEKLKKALEAHKMPEKVYYLFAQLHQAYVDTLTTAGVDFSEHVKLFDVYLELVQKQVLHPYPFEPFHKKITAPFDHHKFGIEFFRPMVDPERSTLLYPENIERMIQQVQAKENVILFANHQTEVDPQLIKIALDHCYSQFVADVIFVAGDRVISDPIAVPLSLGCDLLCIYSKRHIDNPPELKEEKLLHNQRTMKRMRELLEEGGKAIYVAPSGGRDRVNTDGELQIAPFDPSSIEMFRLMAKQAQTPTHFYPLALKTYSILPPPQTVEHELGELRIPSRQGAHFAFGHEIDMEQFPGSDIKDRHARRSALGVHVFHLVKTMYDTLP